MTSSAYRWRWWLLVILIYCCSPHQCTDGKDGNQDAQTSGRSKYGARKLLSLSQPTLNSSVCAIHLDDVLINVTNNAVIATSRSKFLNRNMKVYELNLWKGCLQSLVKDKYVAIMKGKYSSLNYSAESKTKPVAQSPCYDFIYDSNIDMELTNYLNNKTWMLWFPYIKKSFTNNINLNVTQSLFSQCSEEIEKVQEGLSKEILNKSFPISTADIKFLLIPTVQWSCPFAKTNTIVEPYLLANLWQLNRILPQICEILLCNSKMYSFNDLSVQAIASEKTNQSSKCHRYAMRNSSFADDMQIFSFYDQVTGNSVFLMGEYNNRGFKYIRFLILFHFAKDVKFRQCCTHVPDSQLYTNGKSYYLFCYGMSNSCRSTSNLWFTEEVFKNNYLVIMREDIVHSEVVQLLVTLSAQVSSLLYNYILNLEYTFTTFTKFKILTFKTTENDTEKMKIIISELENKEIHCNATEYFTMCKKHLIYLVFLHNCSLSLPPDDKIILLLINNFLDIGLNVDYMCERNTSVVMTSATSFMSVPLESMAATSEGITFYRSCFQKGIWTVKVDFMAYICDEESRAAEEQQLGYEFYYIQLNYFLIFSLHLSEEPAVRQLTLQDLNDNNSTMDIIPHEGTFKNYRFRISQFQVNPINPAVITTIGSNSNETLLSKQHTLRLFMIASVINDTRCLQALSGQNFAIHASDSKQLQYLIGPNPMDLIATPCLNSLPDDVFYDLRKSFKAKMLTINKFWPSCSYNMLISWKGNKTMVVDWDYLPDDCKVQEIASLCLSITITLLTILGNISVLMILIATGLLQRNSFQIHFSMAVADLSLGIMPGILAIYDHLALINGSLTLYDLDTNGTFADFLRIMEHQTLGFQQVRFERSGYPMLCSVMLNISVYVSLLSLGLLSIERFQVVRNRPLSRRYLKFAIGLTWVLGIGFSLLVNWRQNGWSFVGYFDPITKLTINVGSGHNSMSSVSFYLQMAIAGTAGLIVVVLSIISIIYYHCDEHEKQKALVIHDELREEKLQDVTLTFIYMVVLFVIASLPLVVDISVDLATMNPVGHFLAWWIFMAGASWNWALYSFRGKKFREERNKLLCSIYGKVRNSLYPADLGYSLELSRMKKTNSRRKGPRTSSA